MEDICGIKQSPCMIRMQHIGIRNMKRSSFLKKGSWRASLRQRVKEKGTISLNLECMVVF